VTVRRTILLGLAVAGAAVALWLRLRTQPDEAPPATVAPVAAAPEPVRPTPPPVEPPPIAPATTPPTAAVESPPPTAVAPAPPAARHDRPDAGVPGSPAQTLRQALAGATLDESRLFAEIARTGRPVPPEAHTLVEMKKAGASAADLAAYVRSSFPPDLITRANALKWIRINVPGPVPPASDGKPQARTRMMSAPGTSTPAGR
jgi:hypothetical protein